MDFKQPIVPVFRLG